MTNPEVIQALGDFIVTKKPKSIQLNQNTFTVLAVGRGMFLDICTNADSLKRGYIGTYLGVQMWLSLRLPDNWLRFSKADISSVVDDNWSLPVNLEWDIDDIPRMWKIKAFW